MSRIAGRRRTSTRLETTLVGFDAAPRSFVRQISDLAHGLLSPVSTEGKTMAKTTYVTNLSTLNTAISKAASGDTIVLKSGNYGTLALKNKSFGAYVNIESQTKGGAKFTAVDIDNSDHFSFSGLTVSGEFRADNTSSCIKLSDSKIGGGTYFRDATSIVLTNNDITGTMNAVTLNDVRYVNVSGNTIHDAQSDLLRVTGDSYDVKILNNKLLDVASVNGDHPDMIQFIGTNGQTPTKVQIKGNVLYDDPSTGSTWSQGIFISDPTSEGYRDFLIEDNLINVGSPNGIYVNGGISNVVVRDNTLAIWPDGTGGSIRVVEKSGISNKGTKIEHNLARQVLNETTSLSSGLKISGNTLKAVSLPALLDGNAGVDTFFTDLVHDLVGTDLLF